MDFICIHTLHEHRRLVSTYVKNRCKSCLVLCPHTVFLSKSRLMRRAVINGKLVQKNYHFGQIKLG